MKISIIEETEATSGRIVEIEEGEAVTDTWCRFNHCSFQAGRPGANPTTFEFTATTQALWHARAFFKVEENFFVFKTR
jgi:hypothetical protein